MPSRHPPSAHRAPSARPLPLPPSGTNETKWNTFSNSPPLPQTSPLLHVTNVTGCYTTSTPHRLHPSILTPPLSFLQSSMFNVECSTFTIESPMPSPRLLHNLSLTAILLYAL